MKKSDVRTQSIQLKNINFCVSSQFKKDTCGQIRLERGKSFTRPGKKVKRNEEKCLVIVNTYLNKILV